MDRTDSNRTQSRGFGLAELMVALVVMGAVLIAVFGVFFRSQNTSQRMTRLVDSRQNARAAVQLLERDMRMAGSGWGSTVLNASVSGVATQLRGLNAGYVGGLGNDSLSIIGGWSTVTKLTATMTTNTSNIKVASVAGFAAGDLIVITTSNSASAQLLQCTAVDATNSILTHSTVGSIYNTSAGFNAWPGGGFGANSLVYRATWVKYRFDQTNFKKPCLVRQEFGQSPSVAAWNVNGFQVFYSMQDGSFVRNPTNPSMIDEVQPVVHYAYATNTQSAHQDSAWSSVQPRTF